MKTLQLSILVLAALIGAACGDSAGDDDPEVAAPTQLKVVALEGGAHLTWKDNSDNESEFMIERKTGGSGWTAVGDVPFDTTQYHDGSIQAGATYTYRVMAMPKSGGHDEENGAFSNEVDFTAPDDAGAGAAAGSSAHDDHHE
jgi:hypothetical protein